MQFDIFMDHEALLSSYMMMMVIYASDAKLLLLSAVATFNRVYYTHSWV